MDPPCTQSRGFVQEWRAETALDALRNMISLNAIVVRDGQEQVIPAREVLPGDMVILDAGDRVPADMSITHAAQLKVDESVLTGESVPLDKVCRGENHPASAPTGPPWPPVGCGRLGHCGSDHRGWGFHGS